jgi:hypothetical protein
MADDTPEDATPPPDSGRAKRPPPTIDLEASEVTSETQGAGEGAGEGAEVPPEPSSPQRSRTAFSSALIAAVSGAVAAALVIAVAWFAGWPGEPVAPTAPAAPQVSSADIDALAARVASVESKTSKPAASAPDPAAAARIAALEQSLASLRGDLAASRSQSEKLAADLDSVKSVPRESAAPVDLSGINDRLAEIERTTHAQSSEIAQETAKPADDVPLRRIVAAALLDVLVRSGDPYPAALSAAKSLAPDPDALKPLDGFAASGVPSAAVLSRELLTLVPKLQPPMSENAGTGTGIVERLQAGAAKLVRIERTDAVGNDRGNVVARITAAALRNDSSEARRELNTLSPADRAAAQGWLDKADARDAALAASRQFAAETMTALAKPAP